MAGLLTHTVAPSGADFTTLGAAVDHLEATHADLVSLDVVAEIVISGTWAAVDTAACLIHNITTDATRYIKIYTTGDARHAGVWKTDGYILARANNNSFDSRVQYIWIDGLQVSTTSPAADARHCIDFTVGTYTDGANWQYISNCIVKGHNDATYNGYGINTNKAYQNSYIWNTVVYNVPTHDSSCKCINAGGATCHVYSSVLIGGYYCIHGASGTCTIKNIYAGGSSNTDIYGVESMTTCATEDSSGTSGLRTIAIDTDTFVNVSSGTEDFHLAADGLSPLVDVGTDTSGEDAPLNFTTDIDGVTRSGTWDIGADEYVASGVETNVVQMIL